MQSVMQKDIQNIQIFRYLERIHIIKLFHILTISKKLSTFNKTITFQEDLIDAANFQYIFPINTGRKLNVHKTFRRRPGRLLNVLCTFNLRPMSTGLGYSHEQLGSAFKK